VLREVEVFTLGESGKYAYEGLLPPGLRGSSQWVQVRLNGKTQLPAHRISTLKIDMRPFLRLLLEDLLSRGVRFLPGLLTRDSLARLQESVVFNCAGLGSRELFGDAKVKGLKGYILEYRNPDPEKYRHFVEVAMAGREIEYYMHPTRILVGRTVEASENREVDPAVVQGLLGLHRAFLQRHGLSPPLSRL
jgi:hypothetical protein